MPARLNVSELPEYRTGVGKSSDSTVPSGPYTSPITVMPSTIISTAPVVPAANNGAITRPKKKIAMFTDSSMRRRPRSARTAEIGMNRAKNSMENSCMTRNFSRV